MTAVQCFAYIQSARLRKGNLVLGGETASNHGLCSGGITSSSPIKEKCDLSFIFFLEELTSSLLLASSAATF